MQEVCCLNNLVFAYGDERCLVQAMLVIAQSAAWGPLQRSQPVIAIGTHAEHGEAVGGSCERVTHERWLYEFMPRLITTTAAESGNQLSA